MELQFRELKSLYSISRLAKSDGYYFMENPKEALHNPIFKKDAKSGTASCDRHYPCGAVSVNTVWHRCSYMLF